MAKVVCKTKPGCPRNDADNKTDATLTANKVLPYSSLAETGYAICYLGITLTAKAFLHLVDIVEHV